MVLGLVDVGVLGMMLACEVEMVFVVVVCVRVVRFGVRCVVCFGAQAAAVAAAMFV